MLRVSWTIAALLDRVEPAAGLRDLRRDRREVDDRAAAAREHVRVHGLRGHHRARDVDVQRLEPVGARRREALVDVRAGEVDEEVDAAEARGRRGGELLELRVVADVGGGEQHRVAELVHQPAAAVLVDVGDRDARARGDEGAHDRGPDQGRAAGDDRRLALEPTHRPLLVRCRWLDPTTSAAAAGRLIRGFADGSGRRSARR